MNNSSLKSEILAVVVTASLIGLILLAIHARPHMNKPAKDFFRIAWKRGTEEAFQDIPVDGKVYFIYTHKGIYYFSPTEGGPMWTLTNMRQLGKTDQQFVLWNIDDLARRWQKPVEPAEEKKASKDNGLNADAEINAVTKNTVVK